MASTWISFSEVVRRARVGGRKMSRWTAWRLARRVNSVRLLRGELPILRKRRGRGGGYEVWLEALEDEASDEPGEMRDLLEWRIRRVEGTQRHDHRVLREHDGRLDRHDREHEEHRRREAALSKTLEFLRLAQESALEASAGSQDIAPSRVSGCTPSYPGQSGRGR